MATEGSIGAGCVTVAPWIAVYNRRITTSATSGVYLVYLSPPNITTLTLSLAFGIIQFEEQFGVPSTAFPRMRSAAARLQEMFSHLIPSSLNRNPK
jgi:MrcB-like, N-terminal domain